MNERNSYITPSAKRKVYGENISHYRDYTHTGDTFSTIYNTGYSKPSYAEDQKRQE